MESYHPVCGRHVQPSRVLIVEDEAVVGEDLSRKITALGYDVVGLFSTGESAISAAKDLTPDLILLDLQLTGKLDGVQTAELLHRLCDAAIVVVTAHSDAETVKRAIDTGPYGYILKPFSERDLAVQLDVALHKHRADRALRDEQEQLRRKEADEVHERKQTEEGLRVRGTQLQLLYELASAVNRADDLPSLYQTAIDAIIVSLKANRASILTIDEHAIMRFQASRGLSQAYCRAVEGHSPWKTEDIDPAPITVSDVSASDIEPALQATILQEGIRSLAFIPITYGGRLIGKFMLYFDSPHAMTAEDVEMAQAIANSLGIGIERKRVELAVRSSEQRMRSFLDNSAIVAWLKDEEGRHVFLSDNYVRRFGLEAWQDKTDFDLWPPDIAEGFRRNDLLVLATDQPLEVIEQARMSDGTVSFWLNSKFWFKDASGRKFVGGVGVDVTERKRVEESLRESEERLRLASLATNEAIWDWNVASDQVVWNRNVATLFGWSEAAERPHPSAWWVERVHPEDRTRVVDHFFASVGDPLAVSWTDEYRFRKSDGSHAYVLDRAFAIRDASGKAVRMLGTMLDITELKEAQFRLQHFAEELERKVTSRTVELIETQDRLRALSVELSLGEHRQRKRLAIELHDHLQQLLVLAKIQVGQGKRYAIGVPGCESVMKKLDDVLSEALTYTRTLVADLSPPILREHGLVAGLKWLAEAMKKHELDVAVSLPQHETRELPEETTVLLFQSVRELLINSSKHAGTGRAAVSLQECNGQLVIEVRDEGKGFNLAPQADTDAKGDVSSSFGLFAIRERMRAIAGSLEIHSSPGEGTTATLSVPVPADDNRTSKRSAAVPPSASAPSAAAVTHRRISRSVRVVLVDDHTMVRQGLRSILQGYNDVEIVGEAADGEAAVALVDRVRPQVVVMDINMPKKTGIEATAEIKARHPEILVIGLSVSTCKDNEESMFRAGAAVVLNKESAVDHLYDGIRRAVSIHRTLSPSAEESTKMTVLLIDGRKQDREYWAQRLKMSSSEYVVLEADTAASGLAMCRSIEIDCVVLEVGLPDMSGYQVLLQLVPRVSSPEIAVILLSGGVSPEMAQIALTNGAQAYLIKSQCSGDDLHSAIQRAVAMVGPRKNRQPKMQG